MFGTIKSLYVMFNRKTLSLFAATLIAGLVFAGSAQAGLIDLDGTATTVSGATYPSLRPGANVTNGSGMTGSGATGTHTGDDPDQGWLSNLSGDVWLTVNFGATYDVETMYVWNGESGVAVSGPEEGFSRGVATADIYYVLGERRERIHRSDNCYWADWFQHADSRQRQSVASESFQALRSLQTRSVSFSAFLLFARVLYVVVCCAGVALGCHWHLASAVGRFSSRHCAGRTLAARPQFRA